MQKQVLNSDKNIPIKKRFCINISMFLMRIYEHFRGCSGVKEETEKRLKQHDINEEKVNVIEENIPRIMSEAEKLMERNRYLENRVVYMFNELKDINSYALKSDCKSIVMLLKKYDLNKELEY